jgi:hypothetical protein
MSRSMNQRYTISTFIAGPYKVTLRQAPHWRRPAAGYPKLLYELIVSDGDKFPDLGLQFIGTPEEAQQRFEEKKTEVIREVARLALGL